MVQMKGKTQNNITRVYNLDVIISVGYRVKNLFRGTQFRIWSYRNFKRIYAKRILPLDDERLKGNGGGSLLERIPLDRIRDIRSF